MSGTSFSLRRATYSRFPDEEKNATKDCHGGIRSRLINFLKPGCLGKVIRKKTRAFNEPEKQMQMLQNKCQMTTLGDWLLDSPASNHNFTKECVVYSPKPSKNALHPSIDSGNEFDSMKESIKLANDHYLCNTQSGNTIKRVQFRIPEVVDVFIIDSPEELLESHLHTES